MKGNEMKEYCIYIHTFPNGKRYIGQTCQDPEKRWRGGLGYKECPAMYSAINKYGWDNIEHEVIMTGLTREQANKTECELINKYDSINSGYNLAIGGGNARGCYLNRHILDMLYRWKKYGDIPEDSVIELAEASKYDAACAAHLNILDDYMVEVHGENQDYARYWMDMQQHLNNLLEIWKKEAEIV